MTKTPITVHIHGAIAVTSYPASLRLGGSWSLKFLGGSVISYPLNRLLSRSSTRLIGTSRSISRILFPVSV